MCSHQTKKKNVQKGVLNLCRLSRACESVCRSLRDIWDSWLLAVGRVRLYSATPGHTRLLGLQWLLRLFRAMGYRLNLTKDPAILDQRRSWPCLAALGTWDTEHEQGLWLLKSQCGRD